MDIKKLLEIRKKAKKGKPGFVVKESKYQAGVKARWRYPRGLHSPIRQRTGNRLALPRPGYGSPRAVRGLHSSGLQKIVVHTEAEMSRLNPVTQGAVIGSTVGGKKRLVLLAVAEQKKIRVLSVKNIAKTVEKITTAFQIRTKAKVQKTQEKTKKEQEKLKRAEEKKKKEDEAKSAAKAVKTSSNVAASTDQKEDAQQVQQEEREAVEKELIKRQ